MSIFGDFHDGLLGDKKLRKINKDFDEYELDNQENLEKFKDEKEILGKTPKRSFAWLYILICIIFLILFSKLWVLQIKQGTYNRSLAEGNRIRTKNISAVRGIIYDRDGNVLVKNVPSFNLVSYPADLPKDNNKREDIYKKISSFAEVNISEIKDKIPESELYSLEPKIIKENIDRNNALILKEKLNNISGFAIEETATRNYNVNYPLAHILGYVGKISQKELEEQKEYLMTDMIGKTGVEESYEAYLKGKNGKQQVEVDAQGKVIRILASQPELPGNNIFLTIDSDLQMKVKEVLAQVVIQKKGKGVAIVENTKTGEILAMVSLPDYNNNIFTTETGERFNSFYNQLAQDPAQPLFDRAIKGVYPPGSTIKPLMATAGLQEGIIKPNTTIFAPEAILVPNKYDPSIVYRFPDWKPGGHGMVNVYSAISQSCDIYFYAVGGGYDKIKGLGFRKIEEYWHKFYLGKKSGIDLPGESEGLTPNEEWKQRVKGEVWYQGDTYHVSIGQGDLLVTPLQLVNYISTIANGGIVLRPHIVAKITDWQGNTVKEFKNEINSQPFINKDNINIVRDAMRQAITSGSGRQLASLPVSSAGKTGTAQFDNNNQAHAWFTAFAPYEDPQIAVVVLVEGGGEGHETAVPVAREIINYYFTRQKK